MSELNAAEPDVSLNRLEENLIWYDRHANRHHGFFIIAKGSSLLVAATIPVLSGFGAQLLGEQGPTTLIVGILGAAIVVLEGLLRLFQSEQHWLRYRSTWLALKREKALYLAGAGPYAKNAEARRLMAENVEALLAQENQNWVLLHQERETRDATR